MSITLNSFTPNTKIESSKVNTNFTNVSNHIRPAFIFTLDEVLIVGVGKTPILIVPRSYVIEKVYGVVKTAATGADIIIDLNKNGTSIWASNPDNRLTIPAGSTSVITQTSFDTTAISEGDTLTMDLDQVGSTIAGETLTVMIKCN